MKTFMKLAVFALIVGIMLFGFDALAAQAANPPANASDDIFQRAFAVTASVFKNVRLIVYIIGGFGLIGLAFMGILGKIQFKWLVALAVGLAIVAAADLVVSYATEKTRSQDNTASVQWTGAFY